MPGPGRGALAAMLLLRLLEAARGCPACFCFATPDTLQCRFVRLTEPPELPGAVRNLSIVGGRLAVLRAAAFAGGWGARAGEAARPLPGLALLQLTRDGIEALEDAAFAGLPALATLDLSHNPLRAVAPGAFRGLARLRTLRLNQALPPEGAALLGGALRNLSLARLELAGNGLRALPPAAALPAGLAELDVRNNSLQAPRPELLDGSALRLQLAPNPLRCDCASLRPLLRWLRNSTARAPDALSLRCAAPSRLGGTVLARLRPSQLDCPAEDLAPPLAPDGAPRPLQTASYVFFGAVLALVGLVFLAVLYLNRRGIQRWLRNLREACRDQMEGYHYRYEQDGGPRGAGQGAL
ncbi:trophoblast glycoprotein-like [Tiliqua scincoides]|uniref:trophoblast glycoprotein-like n=1 Tax=Tiliqua scincoides TaxID=71010 RepID=UPI00346242AF